MVKQMGLTNTQMATVKNLLTQLANEEQLEYFERLIKEVKNNGTKNI